MVDIEQSPTISKNQFGFLFLEEYHSVSQQNCPNYFDEIYVPIETNEGRMHLSYQKLNAPCQKTNVRQKALSYVGPSFWDNLNKTLKTSSSLNAFTHNIKKQYFNELK